MKLNQEFPLSREAAERHVRNRIENQVRDQILDLAMNQFEFEIINGKVPAWYQIENLVDRVRSLVRDHVRDLVRDQVRKNLSEG